MTTRASIPVESVADLLSCHVNHVRNLISVGEIEAHRIGARGVRVYADSVEAFRRRNAVVPTGRSVRVPQKVRTKAASAAYAAAIARLKKTGTFRPLRIAWGSDDRLF